MDELWGVEGASEQMCSPFFPASFPVNEKRMVMERWGHLSTHCVQVCPDGKIPEEKEIAKPLVL